MSENTLIRPSIFISYAKEWRPVIERLYEQLQLAGCAPWMDKRSMFAGVPWRRAIEDAIRECDFFVACITRQFNGERRFLQREIKTALDVLQEVPSDQVFIIPVRLEPDCEVPREFQDYQWLDYYLPTGLQA
jgi:TIR domain